MRIRYTLHLITFWFFWQDSKKVILQEKCNSEISKMSGERA